MGFSLHIQRFDGRDAHLEIADVPSVISVYEAIPWNEEVAQWEKLTEEDRELRRPLLQIFGDAGHTLHVMPFCDEWIAVTYNFLNAASPFGVDYEEEEDYLSTDRYPRQKFRELVECFFQADTMAMINHLGEFPMTTPEGLPAYEEEL